MRTPIVAAGLLAMIALTGCSGAQTSVLDAETNEQGPLSIENVRVCEYYNDESVCDEATDVIAKDVSTIFASAELDNIAKGQTLISEWWDTDNDVMLKSSEALLEFDGKGIYHSNIKISEGEWRPGNYAIKVVQNGDQEIAEHGFTVE